MLKLLLLAAFAWLIYMLLKKYGRSVERDAPPPPAREDMVRCSHCGVHLPESEAILSRGEHFCSDEHRRLRQQD